ncbi:MAG: DUF1501 domain-containing protein [Isosphaeraceae bacterium]
MPQVVVLDNAGLHTGRVVRAARAGLARRGIYLYFLPPYSPELNEIEPVFRQVKYQEMPQRATPPARAYARRWRKPSPATVGGSDPNVQKDCVRLLSHLETFDPKPDAPAEYRGKFSPIPTSVPGTFICEKLPELARLADRYCIVRSMAHDSPGHVNATHTVLTGFPGEPIETPPFAPKYPDIFTAAHKLLPDGAAAVPKYVALPRMRYIGGGHFGPSYSPFSVSGDPNAAGFDVPGLKADTERLTRRSGLLDAFDRVRTDVDRSGVMDALDTHRKQAAELLTGQDARRAFDLSREDPRIRDRYGRNVIGQRCLLARRLVEAGVRLVTVDFPAVPGQKAFSWDDHASVWNIFEQMDIRLPVLDRGLGTDRGPGREGLDRETLVVVMGEMGRTPGSRTSTASPGVSTGRTRLSFLMAGGGIADGPGDRLDDLEGEEPKDDASTPATCWRPGTGSSGSTSGRASLTTPGVPSPCSPGASRCPSWFEVPRAERPYGERGDRDETPDLVRGRGRGARRRG